MKKIKKFFITYKLPICLFIIGLSLGLLVMSFFFPKRIVTLNNGDKPIVTINDANITSNDYYSELKSNISIDLLIEMVDEKILDKKYETTSDMLKEIEEKMKKTIKEYMDYYKYTEEEFLTNNGFKTKDDFKYLLLLEHKRNLYLEEYLTTKVKNSEINNYYIKKVNADMEIKYITSTEKILTEMLNELNKGKTYEEIVNLNKKRITYKDYSYVSFDNSEVNTDIYNEALALKENSYTKSLVSINGDYYIIFKGDVKDKTPVKDIKDIIIKRIVTEKISNDTDNKLYHEALENLHDEENLTFFDTELKEMYQAYLKKH